MAKVEIYTKATCPYCMRAKALFEHKGVAFEEIKIDFDNGMRNVMIERSQGAFTVPQIFINDAHVGGCDDVMLLHTTNKLDDLLSQ